MWHRLALALGATVEELRERMTGREFAAWCEYYAIEPFGALRDEYHARMIAAAVARALGANVEMSDFALRFGEAPRKTPAHFRQLIAMAAAAGGFNVDDNREPGRKTHRG